MPSPERPPGQPSPEQAPRPWTVAARYPSERAARQPYVETQEAIFQERDAELSSVRFQLNTVWHVAVFGQPPSPAFVETIQAILSDGERVMLPGEVLQVLVRRRAEMTRGRGRWVEHHHRPGKRL